MKTANHYLVPWLAGSEQQGHSRGQQDAHSLFQKDREKSLIIFEWDLTPLSGRHKQQQLSPKQ